MTAASSSNPSGSPSGTVPGRLVVLAGPSGVGKSRVVAELQHAVPDLWFSVSATTRPPRVGEVDGRDYHFVDRAGFDELVDGGELLEWAEVHGGLQRSGTPRRPVDEARAQGRPVLVEVDLQGARSVKAAVPDSLTVFLAPPSFEELARRLTDRGTESAEQRDRRLRTAVEEMAAQDEFDVVVVNDDLTDVVARLVDLISGAGPGRGTGAAQTSVTALPSSPGVTE